MIIGTGGKGADKTDKLNTAALRAVIRSIALWVFFENAASWKQKTRFNDNWLEYRRSESNRKDGRQYQFKRV
jgi:hypothetical protein